MRLADADVLPFDFKGTAATAGRYIDEVEKLAESERERIQRHNRLVREGRYRHAADPRKPFKEPEAEPEPPFLNFAPLKNAHAELARASSSADKALVEARQLADVALLEQIDRIIYSTERQLTRGEGLPRRPWFRHHLYAPGFYTGYGVKTLPGVREGIEEGDWAEAQEQIAIAAERLAAFAAELEKIVALVGGASDGR